MDACFFSVKTLETLNGYSPSAELHIKNLKYISKSALQFAALLHSQQDFKKACKIIPYAYQYSCKAIKETLSACRKNFSAKAKTPNISKSKLNKILLIERGLPTLESLSQFISTGVIKRTKIRSALGIKTYPDWVYSFRLENITSLIPTKTLEFSFTIGIQSEFTKDSILYKIALMCACLYYKGLALRDCGDGKEGGKYLGLAYKLISSFFPKNAPVCIQVKSEIDKGIEEKSMGENRIRRNKSVILQKKNHINEENSVSRLSAAYGKSGAEIKKAIGKKKGKKNRSDANSIFRDIHNSISFTEPRMDYE